MAQLVSPHPYFHRSFVAAVDEFGASAEPIGHAGLWLIPGIDGVEEENVTREQIARRAGFNHFVARLLAMADPTTRLPDGIVHTTHLWWVDHDTYLGRLSIRHTLSPWLRDFGGHIGYVVRPSARRCGHATAMLRASLPIACCLGIDHALVTCDDTNDTSRRVIEAAGGVFEDRRGRKLRYWIATSPRPS